MVIFLKFLVPAVLGIIINASQPFYFSSASLIATKLSITFIAIQCLFVRKIGFETTWYPRGQSGIKVNIHVPANHVTKSVVISSYIFGDTIEN